MPDTFLYLHHKINVGNAMKLANIPRGNRRILIASLIALLMISSAFSLVPVSMSVTPPSAPNDPEYISDYGVLHDDTYVLYPWEEKSLDIGFSKYGEMINPGTPGADDSMGLLYDGIDAFASPVLNPLHWSNGWVMDIHFVQMNTLKRVWAYALFSDLMAAGGDWKQMQHTMDGSHPADTYGGRRTSGWCITDPIRVIYDGPRKAIYLLKTTVYDADPDYGGTALVELTNQILFNKVKKYVMEIKDIKRLEESKWCGPFQVEFSQRGEWDIGTEVTRESYAEFYNGLLTKYDKHPFYGPYPNAAPEVNDTYDIDVTYDLCQMISTEHGVDKVGFAAYWPALISKWVADTTTLDREALLTSMETYMYRYEVPDDPEVDPNGNLIVTLPYESIIYPRGQGVWKDDPWVFRGEDDTMMEQDAEWRWTSPRSVIIGRFHWKVGDLFSILFKRERLGAVSSTERSEPNGLWRGAPLEPMECCEDLWEQGDPGVSYGMRIEPRVPYVFGEWDFELSFDSREASTHQFRCVTLFGLTDNNDAKDPDTTHYGSFMIDSEVQYQLDEVFNPWDLKEAAHKETFRWAQKGALTQQIPLNAHLVDKYGNSRTCLIDEHKLVVPEKWGKYCESSEKVLLLDSGGGLQPLLLERPDQYTIALVDGHYLIVLDTLSIPNYSYYDRYKVLYSTRLRDDSETDWATGRWEWTVIGKDSLASDSAGAAMISTAMQEWKHKEMWLSGLDMKDDVHAPTHPYVMARYAEVAGDKTDYHYDHYAGDHRSALMDDWCTPPNWGGSEIHPYAISSGNVIVVGGPIANLAAEYFNEFTDALVFTGYGDGFYSPACWARTSQPSLESLTHLGVPMDDWPADELWYSSADTDDDIGYAMISTYKDLNGTVGLIVYGYTAEDTYYASYLLRGGLLLWLQHLQPGVTTLLLEIDYEGIHPVGFHVKECLGTFTECTGFDTNFKTQQYEENKAAAKEAVVERAYGLGLCYKLVDSGWCAQLHPDP